MSILVKLDSSTITTGSDNDFTIQFRDSILADDNWECSLVRANIWYSWYNISAANANNVLTYSDDGIAVNTITIPDGNWSVEDINTYIQAEMKDNGHSTTDADGADVYYITLIPNYNTGRVDINITAPYEIDFTAASNFRTILGFDSQVLTADASGESNADITNGINSVMIHCDIIEGSSFENGISSDIIYSFSPDNSPSSLLDIEPVNRIYLPISIWQIHRIRMRLTDQSGNLIGLNGEPVTYLLHLRQKSWMKRTAMDIKEKLGKIL